MAKKSKESEIAFVVPPDQLQDVEIPKQPEFYKLPARFGSVPVDEAPLGWEVETRRRETKVTKFLHAYPRITLPFQEVQRVEFGHGKDFSQSELFAKGANRLIFGDNLHIMRQLPPKSIDLIYIDPPFFSGRNYNVVFGDKNEMRSFSDIWGEGMPGYLIWLNARLVEMKRLLKDTGTIYVHLDWHAAHYVKVEMDKIFGSGGPSGNDPGFKNEIIWQYSWGVRTDKRWNRKHDIILFYSKGKDFYFDADSVREPHLLVAESSKQRVKYTGSLTHDTKWNKGFDEAGALPTDVWYIATINAQASERIGYPTQKPEALLERIVKSSSRAGEIVADFFCGGGTTPAVAQRLNRRWIACDQSRIAVAITADRIAKTVHEKIGKLFPVPDFTIDHWGIYEAPKLEKISTREFKEFVVQAFGGRPDSTSPNIHGIRHGVPLFVGEPSRTSRITKRDVGKFAQAVFKERRSNFGTMLAWNFGLDAKKAAEILAARENKRIDFVRLSLVRLESDEFREHVVIKHKDYGSLLSFIQPPEIRITVKRLGSLHYEFDVSESVSLNRDGRMANVQWDFSFKDRFRSTAGYTFLRDKKTRKPVLVVDYKFPTNGEYKVACSVQDDQGGEKTEIIELEVK